MCEWAGSRWRWWKEGKSKNTKRSQTNNQTKNIHRTKTNKRTTTLQHCEMTNRKRPTIKHADGSDNSPLPEQRSVEIDENKLYRPTLLKMQCRGIFQLPAKGKSLPSCKGISSGLETVKEYYPMYPGVALHNFKGQTSFYNPDTDDDDSGFGGDPENQKKEDGKQTMNLPHVVDSKWESMKENIQEETSLDLKKQVATKSNMKMYGTSSAYLLVLRPYLGNPQIIEKHNGEQLDKEIKPSQVSAGDSSKDASISSKSIVYAIHPVNEFGVTNRILKVDNDSSNMSCSSTTVKLGVLEIHMSSIGEDNEMDDEEDRNTTAETEISAKGGKNNAEDMKMKKKRALDQEGFSPSALGLGMPTLQGTKDFMIKFDKASDKIQSQMYFNATFLKNELKNDFIIRTIAASEKIVLNFEKNLGRMKKTLVDTYNFFNPRDQ